MTKYNAILRLKEEPYNIIQWFTRNFDKEIGALGIGEIKDGEMIIEKLVFPKQKVSGAHVHFKPEDWGTVVAELTPEEISKIIFYWHKHPGSAGASQGDEDDTFDVFMPAENCDRPYFGFMQTAINSNKEFEYEARIELRDPLWTSITNVELVTDKDDAISDICEAIIESKVTFGYASARDQPGASHGRKDEQTTIIINHPTPAKNTTSNERSWDAVFDVTSKNGVTIIEASDYFETWMREVFKSPEMDPLVKSFRTKRNDTTVTFYVVPNKKKGPEILDYFEGIAEEMFYADQEKTLESHLNSSDLYTEEHDIETYNQAQDVINQHDWYNTNNQWRN